MRPTTATTPNDRDRSISRAWNPKMPESIHATSSSNGSFSSSDEDWSSQSSTNNQHKNPRFHELYLPFDSRPCRQTIVFSDGMGLAEVEGHHSRLDDEEERKLQDLLLKTAEMTRPRRTARVLKRLRRCAGKLKKAILSQRRTSDKKSRRSKREARPSISSITVSTYDLSPFVPTIFFEEVVTVFPVPPIETYSEEMRSQLWSSFAEVSTSKRLASFEFRYDGRDWRKATEESGMLIDPDTGSLEHPANFLSNASKANKLGN